MARCAARAYKGAEEAHMLRVAASLLGSIALLAGSSARAETVFSTEFDQGIPSEMTAPGASVQSVAGWANLGSLGNQFSGVFLRYDSRSVVDTRLTLTDLPPHTHLSLGFLLAVIDSWDGVELLEVVVDGVTLFSNSFQLARGDSSSYAAPPGALLSSGEDLGFSTGPFNSHDRAYDLSFEPAFIGIPHARDAVTIVWRLDVRAGGGPASWQGGDDESWAIDNLRVIVDTGPVTTTSLSSTPTSTTLGTTSTTVPGSSIQLLSGKKLVLKPESLSLLSKDVSVTLGEGPESPDDPTIHGGSVRVFAAGGDGFDDTITIPAGEWQYLSKEGAVIGYRVTKAAPITSLQLKGGKQVKIAAKGTGLGHTLGSDPQPVLVELQLGDERYCMAFGGAVKFMPDKKYVAKNADAAEAVCPP
jgi:hypothetical protein